MPTTDPKKKQEQNWKRRYGMSRRAYEKLLAHQGGTCASCGGPPGAEDEVYRIDHDHATGKVRGLLCKDCNTALGMVADDPAKLARLKLYLETTTPQVTVPLPAGLIPDGPDELVTSARPAASQAADPRIPTPEVIAALRAHGLKEEEIAQEFALDRPTVHRLYSESKRRNLAEYSRDLLFKEVLPKALVTIEAAVADGDAKTAVAVLKGLGIFKDVLEAGGDEKKSGTQSFEQWRASLQSITVERITARSGPVQHALDAEYDPLDATPDRGLSAGEPAGPAADPLPGSSGDRHRQAPRPESGPTTPPGEASRYGPL
jgi:hypothetical protein